MSTFSTSLAGLDAEEQALSVISNDLSNLNTTAFKSGTPIFSDLFYQLLGTDGAGDPVQIGVGAKMSSVDSPFSQGSSTTTGVPTDVAIQGNGLFVLDNLGNQDYTRAGNFTLNADGYLVDSNGSYVMGFPANNGTISATQTLAPIVISSGQSYPPNATSSVQLDMNLNATGTPTAASGTLTLTSNPANNDTATIGSTTYTFVTALSNPAVANQILIGANAAATVSNFAAAITGGAGAGTTYGTGTAANTQVTATGSNDTLSLQALNTGTTGNSILTTFSDSADGSFTSGTLTGGVPGGSFSTSLTAYDSLGSSHTLTFNFNETTSGNWNYQITIPAADVGTIGAPQVVATGMLQFNSSGDLVSPSGNIAGINVANLSDGAKNLNITWQLYNSAGTAFITQTAEPSATSGTQQNGYSAGTLESYNIDSSGVINGVLSNGQTLNLGQIALATFSNYDGLTNLGSNDYQASLASGLPSVSAPGTGGSGTLDGGSLEASNVDIATAFTQLIEAERGYEANAKAITTADDVLQASINLIQT